MPELRSFLVSKATPGEWTLPDDQVTDAPEAELAQEIVREKIFRNCYAGAQGWKRGDGRLIGGQGAAYVGQLAPGRLLTSALFCLFNAA